MTLLLKAFIPLALSTQTMAQALPPMPIANGGGSASAASLSTDLTPWDIYLACQGASAVAAGQRGTVPIADTAAVLPFCRLNLPRVGVRFTSVERQHWSAAFGRAADRNAWVRMREHGERVLLNRLNLLGQITVGGTTLEFEYGSSTLSPQQRTLIRTAAQSIRNLLAADPSEIIEVTGYADLDKNGRLANQQQARERAESVVRELVRNGVDSTRLQVATLVVNVPEGTAPANARAAALNTGTGSLAPLQTGSAASNALGGLDVSAFLIGTTDFLIDEAKKQIEAYLLQQGALRICEPESEWRRVLRATCALVPDTTGDANHSRSVLSRRFYPGLETIRQAVREDLRALPYVVGQQSFHAFANNPGKPTGDRERAARALYLLHYLEELGRTRTPLEALQRVNSLLSKDATYRIDSTLPLVTNVERFAALTRLVQDARAELAPYWTAEVLADSAGLYAVKTLAINLHNGAADGTFGGTPGLFANLDGIIYAVRSSQSFLVSLEKTWAELRALPQDSASASTRRGLVITMLNDAVEFATLAMPEIQSGGASDVPLLLGPVRELSAALVSNDAPAAASSLLQLGRYVDARGILGDEHRRILAFTTEIGQARQADEVRGAFQRLVGDGEGYRGKRIAQNRFWRLNAYAGFAGGGELLIDADSVANPAGGALGLSVPIGIEVGWPAGRRGSHGILVQLVDLGAIASARIGNDDDLDSFPEFGFGAVVAPGIFYVQSLGDSPLAMIAGGAYVPQARRTDTDNEVGGFRLSLGVGVDVPLFP